MLYQEILTLLIYGGRIFFYLQLHAILIYTQCGILNFCLFGFICSMSIKHYFHSIKSDDHDKHPLGLVVQSDGGTCVSEVEDKAVVVDFECRKNFVDEHRDHHKLLPYRAGVGMMIVNKSGEVFVGKRVDTKMSGWQMPQGGINLGETPSSAAMREMKEELGSNMASIIYESKSWYSYDIPNFLIPKLWDGKYKGQRQKWFLIKFEDDDSNINIHTSYQEFAEWKWVNFDELSSIVIPFKRKLYFAVIEEFRDLLYQYRGDVIKYK